MPGDGLEVGEPGSYGVGAFFTRPTRPSSGSGWSLRVHRGRGRPGVSGLAPLLTCNEALGASARAVEPSMFHGLVGRGPRVKDSDAFERKLYVIRKRIREPDRGVRARRPQVLLLRQPVVSHPGATRDAHSHPGGRLLPGRPGRSAPPKRDLHVPLAVLHQHVSELAAGPPLPDDLAQRRDQHAPRQSSTGCVPARPSLPPTPTNPETSTRSSRSSARASPTPLAWTTRSSCWSDPVTVCPMR